MTIVTLLGICALALAPCAALYARYGWKAEKTLPFSLCAQSLILYSFGLFLPFSCSIAALCVICLFCGGYFLLRPASGRKRTRFFTLPVVLFAGGAPLLYYACCNRLYLSYDEYSHWGLIVKLISLYDELPRAGAGAPLLLFDYPPAGAMIPALCSALMGYREGIVYFGYALLLWGLLLGLLPEKGGVCFRTLGALFLFLCMMTVFPFTLLRLFSEPLIALVFALLTVYALEAEKTRAQWIRTATLVAFLALTKNSAPLFVALYLLVRVCVRPQKKEWMRAGALALAGAAAFFSYGIYCRVQGIAPAFETYFLQNLRALFSGTLDARYASVPGRFVTSFLTHPFSQSGVYSTYGVGTSAAVLYGGLLAVCALQIRTSRSRRAALRMWGGVWLGTALYLVFILLSYVFLFNPSEAQRLSEMDRYCSLPALWIALIACVLLVRAASRLKAGVRLAAAAALCTALLPLSHPRLIVDTLVTRKTVDNTVWAREETARIAALVRAHTDGAERPKIRLMGACDHMALRYELIGEADWGHPYHNWNEAPSVGTLEGVREELEQGGYAYVLVAGLETADASRCVDARYAPLFDGGEEAIRPFSLYRVRRAGDGSLRLHYIASAE